ncbi:MAG TPA: RNA polymerase sigma factor, partial [Myxococcales bacterium]|nr:RNA polymerase sigma factor [Myxococcales bacterium]
MLLSARLQQHEPWTDQQVLERVLEGDVQLFELIMRRYNERIYRTVRSILHDEAESEDAMQAAYLHAYEHLRDFQARSSFATWLTRIAIHEALARAKRRGRWESLNSDEETGEDMVPAPMQLNPEQQASSGEVRKLLEEAILALPDAYRAVLMLRDVEEMNTAEAAAVLDISEENVKVRLHRARALLRRELYARAGATSTAAFQFGASRCDRVVEAVFARLADRFQS